MNSLYERKWFKINDIQCDKADMIKKEFYFMKDMDTCFVNCELDFVTHLDVDNVVTFSLPELNQAFTPCENTTFSLKNDSINSIVKIKLSTGKLELTCFPFSPNAKYENNIQLFFRLKNTSTENII